MDPISAGINLVSSIIDKIFPDKEAADKAKIEMLRLQQEGQFKELAMSMEAIITEAKSADPWTSRARPSFRYVIYILILFSIPMGIVSAIDADVAGRIAEGVKAWLAAIPEALWAVFGVGYTGYTVARSVWDKKKF
jgi:hypothetical protein